MNRYETSLPERIKYGLGDFAQNGVFTFMSSYFLFFCTDIAGIGLEYAGMVTFIGRMLDALVSPAAGQCLDRIRSPLGKSRSMLLRLALPEAVLLAACFAVPAFGQAGRNLYYLVIYSCYSIIYAFSSVAYSALLARISGQRADRLSLNLFKSLGAACGGVFVTMTALRIVQTAKTPQQGYPRAACVFALLLLAALGLCVQGTKERVRETGQESRTRSSFPDSLRIAVRCKAWRVLCVINFAELFLYSMHTQSVMYYAKYYLADESVSTLILTMLQIASVLVAFVMPRLSMRIGCKRCVILGNLIWCAAMLGNLLARRQLPLVYLCSALASLGWAVATGNIFVMISDVSDLAERQSGRRLDGFITATLIFAMKTGTALAGLTLSLFMKKSAFTAGASASPAVERAILVNYLWIPLAVSVVVILCMQMYPEQRTEKGNS